MKIKLWDFTSYECVKTLYGKYLVEKCMNCNNITVNKIKGSVTSKHVHVHCRSWSQCVQYFVCAKWRSSCFLFQRQNHQNVGYQHRVCITWLSHVFFRNHIKYTLLFKEAGNFFFKIDAQDILLPFWVEPSFCSLFSSLLFLLLVSQ